MLFFRCLRSTAIQPAPGMARSIDNGLVRLRRVDPGGAPRISEKSVVMNILTQLARGAKLVLAPLVLAALAACTSNFNADVSRFESQLPAPAGQTFTVVAADPALQGGIEFGLYAQKVAD